MKKIKLIIDGKEIDAEIDETQLEKKKGKWMAERGGTYFYVDSGGLVRESTEHLTEYEGFLYLTGDYFKTKKEAIAYKEYQIALGTILRARDELVGDWKPNQWSDEYKHTIEYAFNEWRVHTGDWEVFNLFGYYQTEAQALHIIDTQ